MAGLLQLFSCLRLAHAHQLERLLGCHLLGFLLTPTGALCENVAVEQQFHGEHLGMIGAALACQTVLERFLTVFLHDLLQLGLVVGERTALACFLCLAWDEVVNDAAGFAALAEIAKKAIA